MKEVNFDDEKTIFYKENRRRRQWANLSQDLLILINRKLYFTDRIRFRAVCKDWRIPIGDRPINELPWIMKCKWVFLDCNGYGEIRTNLSDPVHQKTHTIPNFDQNSFGYARICASKCGWLLLVKHKPNNEINLFFLYSPFSNKVITLPDFTGLIPHYNKATFSFTNPTSPDYVFFVASFCTDKGKLGISTYRKGDSTWRTKILDGYFQCPVGSIVCTEKGVLYFVLQCGKLGAFSVESQECNWLVDSLWIHRGLSRGLTMHLVESNGEVLLAKNRPQCAKWEVFRYDGNKRGWVEQKCLGDRALFIGCTSYLRPVIGDTTDLANKILFNYFSNTTLVSKFRGYSLKDGGQYEGSRVYDWIVKDHHSKIWIEPPY